MFKNKESRKGLTRSLIASAIFFICLKPILEVVWKLITAISSSTYSGFVDTIYSNAALGQRDWISFLLWSFVLILTTFFVYMKSTISINSRVKKIELESRLQNVQNHEKTQILKDEVAKIENKIKKRNKFIQIYAKYKWVEICLIIIALLMILTLSYSDLQLNTSFNQRINTIAPFIDETQEEILKSEWAQMRSRKDFEIINNKIEVIAKNNNIRLPKNLLN